MYFFKTKRFFPSTACASTRYQQETLMQKIKKILTANNISDFIFIHHVVNMCACDESLNIIYHYENVEYMHNI